MKRRVAHLPLHTGKAPPWLFKRMTKLAGAVTMAIVEEFGPAEMLRRLSDPWWFQAFGCVLGFDWHSSGVTTVTCGALKEAAKTFGKDLGILVAGGKGATSRKTPQEITDAADRHAITTGERLVYASRMSAKVDSAAVQDGFGIYHHSFFFTPDGQWCVVQQGMDEKSGWARRYHWLAESVDDFVCEPHAAVEDLAERPAETTAGQGSGARAATDAPEHGGRGGRREPPGQHRARAGAVRLAAGRDRAADRGADALCPGPASGAESGRQRETAQGHPCPRPRAASSGLRDPAGPARRRAGDHSQPVPAGRDHFSGPALAPRSHQRRIVASEGGAEKPGDGADPRRWADYSHAHGGKDGTPFPVDRRPTTGISPS